MAQVHLFREERGKARSRRWTDPPALVPRPIPIIKKRLLLAMGVRAVEPEPWSLEECWRGKMTPEFNTRYWKPPRVRWIQRIVTTPRVPPL